jgi:hypothetical protein
LDQVTRASGRERRRCGRPNRNRKNETADRGFAVPKQHKYFAFTPCCSLDC